MRTESNRSFARHSHGTYGIGLLLDGAQRSASGRGEVEACAGQLIASNPEEVHDGRPSSGSGRSWHMVYFEPAMMASMIDHATAGGASVEFSRPVMQDVLLRSSLIRLFDRLRQWRDGPEARDVSTLACEESLAGVGASLAPHVGQRAPREVDSDMSRIRERLADDPLRPPTLDEMAALAGLSKYQVLRRFTRQYGTPPHAWLTQRRADLARRLICEGRDLVTAALESGFSDQSHMTRLFSRQFGFTPGAWKKAVARRSVP